jgi:hypothetical protein
MAYMNQDKKAKIVAAVKPILKKYGIKATFAVRSNMTICLNVKSGKIDFIKNFNETISLQPGGFRNGSPAERYIDINPYWYQEHFSGVAKKFLSEVLPAMKAAGWYDNSDAQTDYFDTAYYVDVNIGSWSKPYELIT